MLDRGMLLLHPHVHECEKSLILICLWSKILCSSVQENIRIRVSIRRGHVPDLMGDDAVKKIRQWL